MNEDLKISTYERVLKGVEDSEKDAVKATIGVMYADKIAEGLMEIYFYSSDFMDEGEDTFQVEYNFEYGNGDVRQGNAMIDTKDVLAAYDFADYGELKTYFSNKYNDDENAWHKIIQEMQEKGLNPSIDESEGWCNR